MAELEGKVALVTGAARNIGRAIALDLSSAGASIVVNALTSRAEAEKTVAMVEEKGGKAALEIADVTDPKAVNAMVASVVKRYGRLDILINNAAVRAETKFEEIKLEDWKRVLSIILDGAFICTQACLPHLRKSDAGAVVNIGGLTAHKGASGRTHVVAAKSGLAGMTRGLALDLAPHNLPVNCVVPGTVDTVRGLPGAPERPAHRTALPPVGRRGTPEEIAAAVRFLSGPGARYITGQTIFVTGGG